MDRWLRRGLTEQKMGGNTNSKPPTEMEWKPMFVQLSCVVGGDSLSIIAGEKQRENELKKLCSGDGEWLMCKSLHHFTNSLGLLSTQEARHRPCPSSGPQWINSREGPLYVIINSHGMLPTIPVPHDGTTRLHDTGEEHSLRGEFVVCEFEKSNLLGGCSPDSANFPDDLTNSKCFVFVEFD